MQLFFLKGMKFGSIYSWLILFYALRIASLEDKGIETTFRRILQEASNITYFEPAGYELESVIEQHNAACRSKVETAVTVRLFAFNKVYNLILHQDDKLFHKNLKVKQTNKYRTSYTTIDQKEYYKGVIAGYKGSYVHMHIHQGILDGCLYTGSNLYYVEPASKHFSNPVPFHSIVYQSNDVDFDLTTVKTLAQRVAYYSHKSTSPSSLYHTTISNMTDMNTCALHLAADHHLYQTFGKHSMEDTIAEMIFHIAQADKIFRSTDFNSDKSHGDNIGFTVAAITVFQDRAAEDFRLTPSTDDSLLFLRDWSRVNHDGFCLSLLFTYQDFDDGVLGVAWVGDLEFSGICSHRVLITNTTEEISLNSAIVTFFNHGKKVPRKASIVTVTHEIGHSFGATHDPNACRPGGEAGNYIMNAKATDGSKPNNYFFSSCSKVEMWPMILYKGPLCFIAHDKGAYCGNKIIEEGEDCDCGYPEECPNIDKCCDHGNITSGQPSCRIKDGYECSPKKGKCCSQACEIILAPNITCRDETECTHKSTCNSINISCPIPLAKPFKTICHHGRKTCSNGACTGSICIAYDMGQCECSRYDIMCHVCCYDNKTNSCISSGTLTGKDIYQNPGSLCGNFTGYCDEYGQCIIVDTANQITFITEALKRLTSKVMLTRLTLFANENWAIMLIVWSGVLVIIIVLRCRWLRLFRAIRTKHFIRPDNNTGMAGERRNTSESARSVKTEHRKHIHMPLGKTKKESLSITIQNPISLSVDQIDDEISQSCSRFDYETHSKRSSNRNLVITIQNPIAQENHNYEIIDGNDARLVYMPTEDEETIATTEDN